MEQLRRLLEVSLLHLALRLGFLVLVVQVFNVLHVLQGYVAVTSRFFLELSNLIFLHFVFFHLDCKFGLSLRLCRSELHVLLSQLVQLLGEFSHDGTDCWQIFKQCLPLSFVQDYFVRLGVLVGYAIERLQVH